MPRNGASEAIGKADFAAALAKLKVRNTGTANVVLHEKGEMKGGEATVFQIIGAGLDEARFFAALDPFVIAAPVYGVGFLRANGAQAFLLGTNRRPELQEAQLEGVKYALRILEEDRAAALDRLRATGQNWRGGA